MRIVAAFGLLLAIASRCAADNFPILVYPCPRAAQAPALDGVLDDASWRQAPLVSGFTYYNRHELAPVQTSFRATYDDRALYLGILCREPMMARLKPITTRRDSHDIFAHESLEIFLDPAHDHMHYVQLAVGVGGSLYDGRRTNPMWSSDTQVAVHLGEDEWSAQLAIPWSDVGVEPRSGLVVGFNVCRNRYLGMDREWSNWSQTQANFHDPARFGHLVLSASPEQIAQLGDEFRKGDRTGPLHVFTAEGFAGTTYRALVEAALVEVDALVAEARQVAVAERSPGVAAEILERLAPLSQRAAQLRQRTDADSVDAATWVAIEGDARRLVLDLRGVLWDSRLAALLASI